MTRRQLPHQATVTDAGLQDSEARLRVAGPKATAGAGIVAGRRGAGAITPAADGRQSDGARDIVRGCRRLLARHGLSSLPEVTLASGRRADIAALSAKGVITIVEVKSSIADFESDAKWPEYLDFCDLFYFAVAPDFPLERLPEEAGWIVADKYGGEIIKPSPEVKLAAARRKAVHLAIARTASQRLQRLADPEFDFDAMADG